MSEWDGKERRASDRAKPPCPVCGCDRSVVVDSPGVSSLAEVYLRVRQCDECRARWRTYESNDCPQKPISGVARAG